MNKDAFNSQVSAAANAYIAKLAQDIDVPESRYEQAIRSYHSVGDWLSRDESTLKELDPRVYIQGSFRLGTAIRPVNSGEHYDVDLVCEFARASKQHHTQKDLKSRLGIEMDAYAKAHRMQAPSESRRCWTLDYADGAQFHLDALPAIPDGKTQRLLLEQVGRSSVWADSAIAITDIDHPHFVTINSKWPHSNPRGYTDWFRSRMREIFEARRQAMALASRASVEDVPAHRVKTPLQEAVQLLKLHRDMLMPGDEDRPISVIITTLCGLSYAGESTTAEALIAALSRMDSHIKIRNGVDWIENPTDPLENFADRWSTHPNRKIRFYQWLNDARRYFGDLAARNTRGELVEAAKALVGPNIAAEAAQQVSPKAFRNPPWRASHKKPIPWTPVLGGKIVIEKATVLRNGFRPAFISDSTPLPKHAALKFYAKTDVREPFQIYWQIVNTGEDASSAGDLRGGFDQGTVERGSIVKAETTRYSGAHTIECFVVKDNLLIARSGVFVVNVA